MAFMKGIIDLKRILFFTFLTVTSQATNLDCHGKAFHCVNSTHFMICVDLGRGISTTIDDVVIPCPSPTICKKTNRFECEFPQPSEPNTSVTIAAPITTESAVTTFAPLPTTAIPFEEYLNTVSITTLSQNELQAFSADTTSSVKTTVERTDNSSTTEKVVTDTPVLSDIITTAVSVVDIISASEPSDFDVTNTILNISLTSNNATSSNYNQTNITPIQETNLPYLNSEYNISITSTGYEQKRNVENDLTAIFESKSESISNTTLRSDTSVVPENIPSFLDVTTEQTPTIAQEFTQNLSDTIKANSVKINVTGSQNTTILKKPTNEDVSMNRSLLAENIAKTESGNNNNVSEILVSASPTDSMDAVSTNTVNIDQNLKTSILGGTTEITTKETISTLAPTTKLLESIQGFYKENISQFDIKMLKHVTDNTSDPVQVYEATAINKFKPRETESSILNVNEITSYKELSPQHKGNETTESIVQASEKDLTEALVIQTTTATMFINTEAYTYPVPSDSTRAITEQTNEQVNKNTLGEPLNLTTTNFLTNAPDYTVGKHQTNASNPFNSTVDNGFTDILKPSVAKENTSATAIITQEFDNHVTNTLDINNLEVVTQINLQTISNSSIVIKNKPNTQEPPYTTTAIVLTLNYSQPTTENVIMPTESLNGDQISNESNSTDTFASLKYKINNQPDTSTNKNNLHYVKIESNNNITTNKDNENLPSFFPTQDSLQNLATETQNNFDSNIAGINLPTVKSIIDEQLQTNKTSESLTSIITEPDNITEIQTTISNNNLGVLSNTISSSLESSIVNITTDSLSDAKNMGRDNITKQMGNTSSRLTRNETVLSTNHEQYQVPTQDPKLVYKSETETNLRSVELSKTLPSTINFKDSQTGTVTNISLPTGNTAVSKQGNQNISTDKQELTSTVTDMSILFPSKMMENQNQTRSLELIKPLQQTDIISMDTSTYLTPTTVAITESAYSPSQPNDYLVVNAKNEYSTKIYDTYNETEVQTVANIALFTKDTHFDSIKNIDESTIKSAVTMKNVQDMKKSEVESYSETTTQQFATPVHKISETFPTTNPTLEKNTGIFGRLPIKSTPVLSLSAGEINANLSSLNDSVTIITLATEIDLLNSSILNKDLTQNNFNQNIDTMRLSTNVFTTELFNVSYDLHTEVQKGTDTTLTVKNNSMISNDNNIKKTTVPISVTESYSEKDNNIVEITSPTVLKIAKNFQTSEQFASSTQTSTNIPAESAANIILSKTGVKESQTIEINLPVFEINPFNSTIDTENTLTFFTDTSLDLNTYTPAMQSVSETVFKARIESPALIKTDISNTTITPTSNMNKKPKATHITDINLEQQTNRIKTIASDLAKLDESNQTHSVTINNTDLQQNAVTLGERNVDISTSAKTLIPDKPIITTSIINSITESPIVSTIQINVLETTTDLSSVETQSPEKFKRNGTSTTVPDSMNDVTNMSQTESRGSPSIKLRKNKHASSTQRNAVDQNNIADLSLFQIQSPERSNPPNSTTIANLTLEQSLKLENTSSSNISATVFNFITYATDAPLVNNVDQNNATDPLLSQTHLPESYSSGNTGTALPGASADAASELVNTVNSNTITDIHLSKTESLGNSSGNVGSTTTFGIKIDVPSISQTHSQRGSSRSSISTTVSSVSTQEENAGQAQSPERSASNISSDGITISDARIDAINSRQTKSLWHFTINSDSSTTKSDDSIDAALKNQNQPLRSTDSGSSDNTTVSGASFDSTKTNQSHPPVVLSGSAGGNTEPSIIIAAERTSQIQKSSRYSSSGDSITVYRASTNATNTYQTQSPGISSSSDGTTVSGTSTDAASTNQNQSLGSSSNRGSDTTKSGENFDAVIKNQTQSLESSDSRSGSGDITLSGVSSDAARTSQAQSPEILGGSSTTKSSISIDIASAKQTEFSGDSSVTYDGVIVYDASTSAINTRQPKSTSSFTNSNGSGTSKSGSSIDDASISQTHLLESSSLSSIIDKIVYNTSSDEIMTNQTQSLVILSDSAHGTTQTSINKETENTKQIQTSSSSSDSSGGITVSGAGTSAVNKNDAKLPENLNSNNNGTILYDFSTGPAGITKIQSYGSDSKNGTDTTTFATSSDAASTSQTQSLRTSNNSGSDSIVHGTSTDTVSSGKTHLTDSSINSNGKAQETIIEKSEFITNNPLSLKTSRKIESLTNTESTIEPVRRDLANIDKLSIFTGTTNPKLYENISTVTLLNITQPKESMKIPKNSNFENVHIKPIRVSSIQDDASIIPASSDYFGIPTEVITKLNDSVMSDIKSEKLHSGIISLVSKRPQFSDTEQKAVENTELAYLQEITNTTRYKKSTYEKIENSTSLINDSHTSTNKSLDQNMNFIQASNKTVILNDQSATSRYMSQTKSVVASDTETTRFSAPNSTKRKIGSSKFSCKEMKRGRYSDELDCRKFYICPGNKSSHVIVGTCPVNTVFSEINKQCTKNLSHCIRNNQFRCVTEGRFSDFLNDNVYYICARNNLSHFIRFKLQCQNGYHLNKTSVRCDLNNESTSTSASQDSKNVSEQSSVATKQEKEKSEKKFKCKKQGIFPDPSSCTKYFECTKVDSSYRQKRKKCDTDEVFHKDKKKCVDADSYECYT